MFGSSIWNTTTTPLLSLQEASKYDPYPLGTVKEMGKFVYVKVSMGGKKPWVYYAQTGSEKANAAIAAGGVILDKDNKPLAPATPENLLKYGVEHPVIGKLPPGVELPNVPKSPPKAHATPAAPVKVEVPPPLSAPLPPAPPPPPPQTPQQKMAKALPPVTNPEVAAAVAQMGWEADGLEARIFSAIIQKGWDDYASNALNIHSSPEFDSEDIHALIGDVKTTAIAAGIMHGNNTSTGFKLGPQPVVDADDATASLPDPNQEVWGAAATVGLTDAGAKVLAHVLATGGKSGAIKVLGDAGYPNAVAFVQGVVKFATDAGVVWRDPADNKIKLGHAHQPRPGEDLPDVTSSSALLAIEKLGLSSGDPKAKVFGLILQKGRVLAFQELQDMGFQEDDLNETFNELIDAAEAKKVIFAGSMDAVVLHPDVFSGVLPDVADATIEAEAKKAGWAKGSVEAKIFASLVKTGSTEFAYDELVNAGMSGAIAGDFIQHVVDAALDTGAMHGNVFSGFLLGPDDQQKIKDAVAGGWKTDAELTAPPPGVTPPAPAPQVLGFSPEDAEMVDFLKAAGFDKQAQHAALLGSSSFTSTMNDKYGHGWYQRWKDLTGGAGTLGGGSLPTSIPEPPASAPPVPPVGGLTPHQKMAAYMGFGSSSQAPTVLDLLTAPVALPAVTAIHAAQLHMQSTGLSWSEANEYVKKITDVATANNLLYWDLQDQQYKWTGNATHVVPELGSPAPASTSTPTPKSAQVFNATKFEALHQRLQQAGFAASSLTSFNHAIEDLEHLEPNLHKSLKKIYGANYVERYKATVAKMEKGTVTKAKKKDADVAAIFSSSYNSGLSSKFYKQYQDLDQLMNLSKLYGGPAKLKTSNPALAQKILDKFGAGWEQNIELAEFASTYPTTTAALDAITASGSESQITDVFGYGFRKKLTTFGDFLKVKGLMAKPIQNGHLAVAPATSLGGVSLSGAATSTAASHDPNATGFTAQLVADALDNPAKYAAGKIGAPHTSSAQLVAGLLGSGMAPGAIETLLSAYGLDGKDKQKELINVVKNKLTAKGLIVPNYAGGWKWSQANVLDLVLHSSGSPGTMTPSVPAHTKTPSSMWALASLGYHPDSLEAAVIHMIAEGQSRLTIGTTLAEGPYGLIASEAFAFVQKVADEGVAKGLWQEDITAGGKTWKPTATLTALSGGAPPPVPTPAPQSVAATVAASISGSISKSVLTTAAVNHLGYAASSLEAQVAHMIAGGEPRIAIRQKLADGGMPGGDITDFVQKVADAGIAADLWKVDYGDPDSDLPPLMQWVSTAKLHGMATAALGTSFAPSTSPAVATLVPADHSVHDSSLPLPVLSSFKSSPREVHGGAGEKKMYQDTAGNDWIFRVAKDKSGHTLPWRADAQAAFSSIAHAIKPNSPLIYKVTLGGKTGSIHPFIPGPDSGPATIKGLAPSALTTTEKTDLSTEHVLDWLFANHDSHGANFVRSKGGHLVAVDKEQAFKHFAVGGQPPLDTLSVDYHPNSAYGESEPYYNTFWKAWRDGKVDFDPQSMKTAFDNLDKISGADYQAVLRPLAETRWPGDTYAQDTFLKAAQTRKNTSKREFEKFLTGLYQTKTGKIGEFTFAKGWVPSAVPVVTAPAAPLPLQVVKVKKSATEAVLALGGNVKDYGTDYYKPEDPSVPAGTKVWVKFKTQTNAEIKKFFVDHGLPEPTNIIDGTTGGKRMVVDKALWDAAFIEHEETIDPNVVNAAAAAAALVAPPLPPTPAKPVYLPTLHQSVLAEPNSQVLAEVHALQNLGPSGKRITLDGSAVEGQTAHVIRRKDTSGKIYYEVHLKLRKPAWDPLKNKGTAKETRYTRGNFDPATDTLVDSGVDAGLGVASRAWSKDGSDIFLQTATQSMMGSVNAKIYLKPGQTVEGSLKQLLDEMKPGLSSEVLRDPSPQERELSTLMRLFNNVDPQGHDQFASSGVTPTISGIKAKLAAKGITDKEIGKVRDVEVAPNYSAQILPGRWAQAKGSNGKPLLQYVYHSCRDLDRTVEVFTKGYLGIHEGLLTGEKYRGASPSDDIASGGADGVTSRVAVQSQAGLTMFKSNNVPSDYSSCWYFIFAPDEMDRLDTHLALGDSFGSTKPSNDYYGDRKTLPEALKALNNHPTMSNPESVTRTALDHKKILRIVVDAGSGGNPEQRRRSIVAKLKSVGMNEVNGVPVEDFVVLVNNRGEVYDKYVAPAGY